MSTFEPSDDQFEIEIEPVSKWMRLLNHLPDNAPQILGIVAGIFETKWIGAEHPWLLAWALLANILLGLGPLIAAKGSHARGKEGEDEPPSPEGDEGPAR